MHLRTSLRFGAAVAVVLIGSCSAEKRSNEVGATMQYAIGGGLSEMNSIEICGARNTVADEAVRCASLLPTQSGRPATCTCYNLDVNGNLETPDFVRGLCPTSVPPMDVWTFNYAVYAAPDCAGGLVPDLVCYDAQDLSTRANANQSIEPLLAGLNTNHVVCITTQAAEKIWEFSSCTITSVDSEALRFECGCTPDGGGGCTCGDAGITDADLTGTCAFETTTCDIVCM